eukprot:162050_1
MGACFTKLQQEYTQYQPVSKEYTQYQPVSQKKQLNKMMNYVVFGFIRNITINAPYDIIHICLSYYTPETQIALTLHSHKGHYNSSYHPTNLLDRSECIYMSNLETSDDWIIFALNTNHPIKPSRIKIQNDVDKKAISSIRLFIGSSERFYQLCDIENIKPIKKVQEFEIGDILCVSNDFIQFNKLNLLKITILNNHGDPGFNAFASFELFGFN